MTTKTITERVGAVVVRVQVQTLESRVDFADILEAVKVSPDDHSPAPWEDCEGWEHTLVFTGDFPHGAKPWEMRGDGVFRNGRWYVITLPDGEDYGVYAYHRARGASKQVARELSAQARAKTIDQLKRWYKNGWQVWYVACDYLGAHDSLGGVYDDSGDYLEDVKREVAENVAAELEKDGFEVYGKPEEKPRDRRAEFRRNLNSQNRE